MKNKEMSREQLLKEIKSQKKIILDLKRSDLESKQVLTALQKSEEQYRDLVEKGNIAIAVDDVQGNTLYFNNQFLDLYGYSAEEMKTNSHKILTHPDDIEMVTKYHNNRLLGKKVPSRYELKGIRKDGSIVYVEVDVCEIIKEKGKISGTRSYFWDITKRKKAEEILLHERDFYHSFVESMSDWVWEIDIQGIHTYSNKAIEDILGYKVEEVVGYSTTKLWNAAQRKRSEKNLKKDLTSGIGWNNYVAYFSHKDGSVRILESTAIPIYNTEKELVGYRGIDHDITKRMQYEQNIRESEAKYKNLVETASDAIYLMSEDGNIIDTNQSACDMLGRSRDEIVGSDIKLVDPNFPVNKFIKFWRKTPFNEQTIFETTHIRKDGSLIPIEISGKKYSLNEKVFYYGVARDITERKKVQEEVILEHNLSESVINNLPGVFYLFNSDSKFLRWNKNFEKISGYSAEEFSKLSPLDLFTGEDAIIIETKIQEVFKKGNSDTEARITTKSNNLIPYHFTGARIDYNGEQCLIGVGTDITERKQSEEALQENEERYRNLVEKAGIAILTDDNNGNLTYFNKRFSELFGYSFQELKGKSIELLIHPDDVERVMMFHNNRLEDRKIASRYEFKGIRKNGSTIYLEVDVIVLKEEERFVGTRSYIWDITERKKAEEILTKTLSLQQATLESTAEGILVVDLQGKIVDYNKKFIEIWDIADSIIPEGKTKDLVAPENAEFAMKHIIGQLVEPHKFISKVQELYTKPEAESFDALHFTDGRVIERFSKPQFIKDYPVGRVWSFRDITKHKKAEEELIKLSTAVNQSPSVIAITDIKGKLEYINPKFTELTGYTLEEVKGLNPRILKSGELPDEVYKKMWETISAGEEWRGEFQNKTKNGKLFWEGATISPILDKSGKTINFLKVAKDITEQKQAERIQKTLFNISNTLNTVQTLNELYIEIRLLLSEIIDTTNLYIALYDKETDILSLPFNIDEKDDFETFPAGKTITKHVIDTGKPLFATKDVVNDLIKKRVIETVGAPSEIWVGVPLKIDNEVIGVIAVQSYDDPKLYTKKDLELLMFVSEEIAIAINHKKSEEQIKRNLEEKNTLLKELYHRTKNNMQVISSMLRIQSHRSNDEFVHESFKEIVHKIQAMALVHQKLYEAEDLSYINLKEYIEDILESLMQSYNIQAELFSYTLNLKDVFVTIDSATPLGLVLNELISNVFKHSFPDNRKGKLTITLEQEINGDINLQLQDNGVGFSSGFNPEKTDSMGLQTVYSLITYQLQGSVNYEVKDGLSWFIKFSDKKKKQRI